MISVIMPTFNEKGNIGELILRTARTLKQNFEIIVIDDNSPDKTAETVKEMQKTRRWLRLLVRPGKQGLPSAIEAGIKQAKGEIISFFDCDLSMPPEKLSEMIKLLPKYNIVNGSRFAKGGEDRRDLGYAKFCSKLINKVAQFFLWKEITDYTGGFLLAKKEVMQGIRLRGEHGSFYISLLYQFKKKGFKITEVPYTYISRSNGLSKISGLKSYLQTGLIYIQKLVRVIYWKYFYPARVMSR